jgi:hypothetical protein
MPFDDLAADGQPHPAPIVFRPAVQALKRREKPRQVLLLEADTIVLDGNFPER